MITFRFDVDYPYSSRFKGFFITAIGRKGYKQPSKDYLENAKTIAKMINQSCVEAKAYWFFTPYTLPDKEMQTLLDSDKHEIALHIVNKPFKEKQVLEALTKRELHYYTVHGTERLLGKLLWRRKPWQSTIKVPESFPLKSFYDYPTFSIDAACYRFSEAKVLEIVDNAVKTGMVFHAHPEWLFNRGLFNHRASYVNILKNMLHCVEVGETS